MTGGAHWSLFEPLGLGHGVEASLQFASYRRTNSPNSYSATFLHLNYVPSWQLIVMRLDFPVGFVVISAADDYQKTAKEFGVRTSFHELGFVVPYIHVRWMSVDSDNRTIMASTGVNFFF
jgi:hypothetical protein